MKIDVSAVRQSLRSFDFQTLFREHLGWENHHAELEIPLRSDVFPLVAVAQRRGFVVYVCPKIPDRATRLKIDARVTRISREHLIVYAEKSAGQQVWQRVRRDPGKPKTSHEQLYDTSQLAILLIHRLDQIAVSLDEEEMVSICEVAGRADAAFNSETGTLVFNAAATKDFLELATRENAGRATSEEIENLVRMALHFVMAVGLGAEAASLNHLIREVIHAMREKKRSKCGMRDEICQILSAPDFQRQAVETFNIVYAERMKTERRVRETTVRAGRVTLNWLQLGVWRAYRIALDVLHCRGTAENLGAEQLDHLLMLAFQTRDVIGEIATKKLNKATNQSLWRKMTPAEHDHYHRSRKRRKRRRR